MQIDRLPGYEYFLVTHVRQHDDYMIRQISARENPESLRGENGAVISVPRTFLEGLRPAEVGKRLVYQYRLEKDRDFSKTPSLVEIDRYFSVNGITLGELREMNRKETIEGLARVCLKDVTVGFYSDFDDS